MQSFIVFVFKAAVAMVTSETRNFMQKLWTSIFLDFRRNHWKV